MTACRVHGGDAGRRLPDPSLGLECRVLLETASRAPTSAQTARRPPSSASPRGRPGTTAQRRPSGVHCHAVPTSVRVGDGDHRTRNGIGSPEATRSGRTRPETETTHLVAPIIHRSASATLDRIEWCRSPSPDASRRPAEGGRAGRPQPAVAAVATPAWVGRRRAERARTRVDQRRTQLAPAAGARSFWIAFTGRRRLVEATRRRFSAGVAGLECRAAPPHAAPGLPGSLGRVSPRRTDLVQSSEAAAGRRGRIGTADPAIRQGRTTGLTTSPLLESARRLVDLRSSR